MVQIHLCRACGVNVNLSLSEQNEPVDSRDPLPLMHMSVNFLGTCTGQVMGLLKVPTWTEVTAEILPY